MIHLNYLNCYQNHGSLNVGIQDQRLESGAKLLLIIIEIKNFVRREINYSKPKSEHGNPAINSGYDTIGGGAS